MAWFATLGVVVVLAIGSAVPGLVGSRAADALRGTIGTDVEPRVTVEADPFLQLPAGHVPRLLIELDGETLGEFAMPDVDIELRDVRVPPAAIWGLAPPVLLAPAPASVRVGGSATALRAELARLAAKGRFEDLRLPRSPLGVALGGKLSLSELELTLEPGRVGVAALATTGAGKRLPLTFSVAPRIVAETRLVLAEPRARVGDAELPSILLIAALSAVNPLFDLEKARLAPDGWRLARLTCGPEGLWVEAEGTIEGLPGKR